MISKPDTLTRQVVSKAVGAWWLWLPIAAGVVLRLWGIHYQVLGGDEMHAVRAALTMPVTKALTTYRPSDHCMPISGFFRLLMDHGVALSEVQMRLPILASSFLALWLIPWWTARRVGREAAFVVGWLVALSPILIHYSRLVRSYMPIVLLSFGAVAAYESWMRSASRRHAALYVFLATLAAYFHLVSVPFVLSPFLYFGAVKLARPGAVRPTWKAAVTLGLATVGGFLLFIVPAWTSLTEILGLKNQPNEVSVSTWTALLLLQSGTDSRFLSALFNLLALTGLLVLWRTKPALAGYGAVLVSGQIIGLFILSPKAMHQGTIFARYMLVTLPFVMIWAAVGLTAPWSWPRSRPWRRLLRVASATLVAMLFVAGPVMDREFRESPFVLRPGSLHFYFSTKPRDIELPEAYRELDPERRGRIVEYPWHTTWRYSSSITAYQRLHGRHVIVAPAERLLWDGRLIDLRNMVTPRLDDILATDAAYLVVHLESAAENSAPGGRKAPPGSALARDWEIRARDLEKFDQQVARRLPVFEKEWGPADVQSTGFMIWDLDRIRGRDRRTN